MASLIDAALGKMTVSPAPAPAPAQASDTVVYQDVGPIWGSFEVRRFLFPSFSITRMRSHNNIFPLSQRNTGTWTPYSSTESANIEAAFGGTALTISVPTCFNAVVHFERHGGNHHQMTPAVGTKPPGFRSVLRGRAGQKATLYWWDDQRLWRLEAPVNGPITHTQEVVITPPADTGEAQFTWQWCDLVGRAAGDAREINWHPYSAEQGAEVEDAWTRGVEKEVTIGLTAYRIGSWQGAYGIQKNLTTGVERQVRRGRFTVLASTPADYVDESCALCTEKFSDTPEWPIRRTPCNHAYHWTCLQHILRQRVGQPPKCPMCRASLAGMSAGSSSGGIEDAYRNERGLSRDVDDRRHDSYGDGSTHSALSEMLRREWEQNPNNRGI